MGNGNIPAATAKPEKPIPFARISNDKTSTGYSACNGVKPTEYTAPKTKMNTRQVVPATVFVPDGSGFSSVAGGMEFW